MSIFWFIFTIDYLSPMKGYILFLLLVTFSLSFKISDISFQPSFKKVVSKFGEVFLHHNTTEYEEVVFEGETTHDGQDYKGAYDTILDVTKNPERQKEFLECAKGKHA